MLSLAVGFFRLFSIQFLSFSGNCTGSVAADEVDSALEDYGLMLLVAAALALSRANAWDRPRVSISLLGLYKWQDG